MLNRKELQDTPIDFNLYQKEKDYLQHIILSRIYSRINSQLVFKGGTSLQKCMGLNRFSEDLDFTASKDFQPETIEHAILEVGRFYTTSYSMTENENSLTYRLKIERPLYRNPSSLQTVKVEISLREQVLLKPSNRIITPLYIDLQPYTVLFMDPLEIMSEKFRALITRKKARDLYDIYFLILKQTGLDIKLVNKKLEFYSMSFDSKVFLTRVKNLKYQWEKEIQGLVRSVPEFDEVISTIVKFMGRYT